MKTRIPKIETPKPVLFGTAVALGAFFFWFTKPAPSGDHVPERS